MATWEKTVVTPHGSRRCLAISCGVIIKFGLSVDGQGGEEIPQPAVHKLFVDLGRGPTSSVLL
ncbi:hypothetical protein M0L20_29760 [Spirosoma sp. RP8]|uniref:Uncharacterized protein n=1 Tax=Spirosoma liriopis TaxID=2937440 RepID=A0ABT0HVU1_9BACT|nr:hypothetical protein [Spirosoma liriopis]MCK8496090.1 hypothetical protein [Spirosoma liriopis]